MFRRLVLWGAIVAFLALWGAPAAWAQQSGSFYSATPALGSSLVAATGANRQLEDFEVSADSTLSGAAWWVMIFDAASLPGNGAVTPVKCYAVPTGTAQFSFAYSDAGPRFQTGVVIGASTTGCFSLTASAHAFIAADVQ